MAREIVYRLFDPGYTIYHRAALGGLAATIRAWNGNGPEGIRTSVTRDEVRISWRDDLTDQDAVRRILDASFRITADKMIDLVGHGIPPNAHDLRLAVHNGLCVTYLQHNKMRPNGNEKEPRRINIHSVDAEAGIPFTYRVVVDYAHRKAQGTGLLDKQKNGEPPGLLPKTASIPQSVVPGAMTGVSALEAPAEQVLLLLFLMVGSAVFLLRAGNEDPRMQACVIIPDVSDLEKFARAMHAIALAGKDGTSFTNTYLNRVVGGAAEAGLRFLLDLRARDIEDRPGVTGCLAITMGKVAWDKNQVNRTGSIRIGTDIRELGVFQAAITHLGNARVLKGKKGDGFAVPASPIPELVAANLGAGRSWVANFRVLVDKKEKFQRMRFAQGGLSKMKEAIEDEDDRIVIQAFHEAWNRVMGALGERARREGAYFDDLCQKESERNRNAILRAKTADALAGWFLRFCADATKGGGLSTMIEHGARIRKFVFEPRNVDRLQNLLLFALVSYNKDDFKSAPSA